MRLNHNMNRGMNRTLLMPENKRTSSLTKILMLFGMSLIVCALFKSFPFEHVESRRRLSSNDLEILPPNFANDWAIVLKKVKALPWDEKDFQFDINGDGVELKDEIMNFEDAVKDLLKKTENGVNRGVWNTNEWDTISGIDGIIAMVLVVIGFVWACFRACCHGGCTWKFCKSLYDHQKFVDDLEQRRGGIEESLKAAADRLQDMIAKGVASSALALPAGENTLDFVSGTESSDSPDLSSTLSTLSTRRPSLSRTVSSPLRGAINR